MRKCISCFSCHCHKTPDRSDLRFILAHSLESTGYQCGEASVAGAHSLESTACQCGEGAVAGAQGLPLLTFSCIRRQSVPGNQSGYHSPGLPHTAPPVGDQVFKHRSLQGTFHIESTTENEAKRGS